MSRLAAAQARRSRVDRSDRRDERALTDTAMGRLELENDARKQALTGITPLVRTPEER